MKKRQFLRYGFTMIEMMFVILIVAVLAGLALFRINIGGMTKTKLVDGAQRIVGDLRYTRSLAITNGAQYKLIVDQDNDEYAIYDSDDDQIGLTKTVDSEITLSGNTEFIFELLGNASSGENLSLSAGGEQYDITIVAATGMISMEEQ